MLALPKRREGRRIAPAGGGGGGGGGGGAGGGPGVAQLAAGPYTVQVESRTRGGLEEVRVMFTGPEEALVESASGRAYRVGLGESPSCECMDHAIRRRICRHIAAARQALGMAGAAAAPTGPRPARAPVEAAAEAAAEAEAARRAERAEGAEQERSWLERHAGADNAILSEMEAAEFERLMAEAARAAPAYEYEDALGGSRNTFGVEIEFDGGDVAAIARDLHREGLIPAPRQEGYHSPGRVPGLWSFERDGSVTGGEVVSPVMRDTPEAWRQIERVCEIIRRHGGQATERCGLHVHIGSAPLDTSARRWYRLARIAGGYEDVLFRIAAGGSSGGRHRGAGRGYGYSRPGLGGRLRRAEAAGDREAHALRALYGESRGAVEQVIRGVISPGGHYEAVNASGHFFRGTVEFRHFNGTLDPVQIQANVKIANGIVQAAQRMRSRAAEAALPDRGMPVGSGARGADPEHRAVRRFLDTIFSRTRDKMHALWLYATSRWQPA